MGIEEQMAEERRLEIIERIRASARDAGYPDFDVESKLAGSLAGPPSENRPNVAVWDYLDYAAATPGVTIDDLAQVRFPMTFYGGEPTVTSIAEELRPAPIAPKVLPTIEDVVRRYRMMHGAGVLGWDSGTGTVQHLRPASDYTRIYKVWWNQLLDSGGYDGPRA